MQVNYWGEVYHGERAFAISFLDFPKCIFTANKPQSLRDYGNSYLQDHINEFFIKDNKKIPLPSEIEMPICKPTEFVGFLPVCVEIPDTFTKEWKKK